MGYVTLEKYYISYYVSDLRLFVLFVVKWINGCVRFTLLSTYVIGV